MFGLGWNVQTLTLPKGGGHVPKRTQAIEGAPPQHPGLARAPACMHDDSHASDTSPFGGPVTEEVDAKYLHRWALVGGICPAFAFDAEGLPVTMSFSALRTDLLLLDPRTLDVLDSLPLPRRKGTFKKVLRAGLDEVFRDTSGGAYFVVDVAGRVIVPAADGQIWIVAIKRGGKARRFEVMRKLRPHIPKGDKLTACLPVWREQGAPLYWYTTAEGTIGIVGDGASKHLALPNGEKIQNSVAVNERGAFVVSNFALYLVTMDADAPKILWRTPYDRGTKLKPGQIDLGSGTTPTLMGSRFVVIGDGSAPMKVLVIDQASGRILDAEPVFGDKRGSASENSVIAHGDTIVVGNTYGYENPLRVPRTEGGLVCFDIDPESGRLKQRWYKPEIDVFTATPKLSRRNGLVYAYSRKSLGRTSTSKPTVKSKEREEWSVLGIDFRTGELVYRLPVFRSEHHTHHDNAWGTLSLGPNDALYLGMWNGCIRVIDQQARRA